VVTNANLKEGMNITYGDVRDGHAHLNSKPIMLWTIMDLLFGMAWKFLLINRMVKIMMQHGNGRKSLGAK